MNRLLKNTNFAGLEQYSDLYFPLEQSLTTAASWLKGFLSRDDFIPKIQLAFGDAVNGNEAKLLIGQLAQTDTDVLPKIEIRSASEINGANAAFAGQNYTIYLSREFLEQNSNNQGAIVDVVLEELGHSIDWKLHPDLDTPGDEGELFSDLVRGVALSESELQRLKTEDDSVIVSIDREVVRLEQASEVFLRNFKAPRGLVVDNQQNLLVSETDILYSDNSLIKFAADGRLLNRLSTGSASTSVKLATSGNSTSIFGLRDDGIIFRLDPNTFTVTQVSNIRNLSLDRSSIYNITDDTIDNLSWLGHPDFSKYNDIAVKELGNAYDLFITGASNSGINPFVIKIRIGLDAEMLNLVTKLYI
ncbi:MAG: hypothetical protein GPI95_18270 [Microcystis aeruginosa LG13-11]|jgi:hypothetical protein|nr:hypothetical protein [Microcystis aeruginosa LG13-11]